MATLVSPISRSTVIWFGSLEFMSTGFGYDMILLSVKGPGGARIPPARLRAPRRPRHHASPPKRRHGQRHHHPSASSRSPVRARRVVTQKPTAPRAETVGMTARRYEDRTTRWEMARLARSRLPRRYFHTGCSPQEERSGQRRGIARQDDMSKCPDVRGETNGPPTRHWSTATDIRAAGFLSGTRPPSPRSWAIHDHLTQATAAGGGTRMLLRHRARLRLWVRQLRPY